MVQMRDGVRLAPDVYRLEGSTPAPALIARTPYNKEYAVADCIFDIFRAVQAGYAVVIQYVRERYAFEGEFNPHFQETQDGVDAFAWAAAQNWSKGVVGTFGASYLGSTQWLPTREQPPPCGQWRLQSPSQIATRAVYTSEELRCCMTSAGWSQTSFRQQSSAVWLAARSR